MNLHTRAFGAPVLAVALALAGGSALLAPAAQAAERLPARGTNHGGFLGVRTQELSSDLRDSYDFKGDGVLVSSVSSDSPADRAGIQEGDIIISVDGESVDSPETLAREVRAHEPGDRVSVKVWRDGRERTLGRVELGDVGDADVPTPPSPPRVVTPRAPEAPPAPEAPRVRVYRHEHSEDGDKDDDDNDLHELRGLQGLEGLQGMQGMMALGRGRLGVEMQELDTDEGGRSGSHDGHGVLVTRVLTDTPAARAGLRAGDVILEFDGKVVENGADLRRLVNQADAGEVELRIERRGNERTITARLGERESGMMQPRMFGNGMGRGWSSDQNNGRTRVYRFDSPNRGEWRGMSDEDRAQLRRDMEQMRRDLAKMRREMHEKMQRGDDDDHGDHGDIQKHDHDDDHHESGDDDDDDDDDGN